MSQENNVTHLVYDAQEALIFRIWVVNLLLKIVTLGIYSFWGKTRLRRYVINSFSLLNDRFEYTGTGGELFRGFLKALPIIFIVYAPFIIWPPSQHSSVKLMFIPGLFLIFAATYTGLHYKYSRTTWRGIRGRLTGSALWYASFKMWRTALNAITLGILIPYSDISTIKYQIEHTYFGSAKAKFNGNASKLMGIHIVTLLLAIPSFGLSRFWYKAALARHIYESTTINTAGFRGSQTGRNMLGLFAGNLLISLLTLGFGMPIIIHRRMKYFADHVTIIGDIETAGIYQSNEVLVQSGEGVYGILGEQDIGFL